MLSTYAEKTLAKVLSYGAAFTAILVVSGSVTDPVNTPKLLSLGVVGFTAIGIVLSSWSQLRNSAMQAPTIIALLFLAAAISATIFSQSPLSQNIYGAYGRNNGLLAYLFLAFIFIAGASLAQQSSFDSVAKALIFAGIVNIIYCGWVILFGDFIGWNNPYGNILGTFGNPNFIGAFLGIFLSAYVAYAISPKRSQAWRWSLLVVVPVTLFEIVDSSAIQGRVVAAGGLALVLFAYLRFRVSKVILGIYSLGVSVAGVFALLGALQIGPLTQFIYKTSVSLRGQYWLAGWNAGESRPFTGLGMDALGDWYRRVRDPQAIILPGVNTTVNAAHNVFMDMFAFGGWPLFLTYLAFVGFTGYSLVGTFFRLEAFDGTFTAIAVAWIGYQVQSIISINQIGLAVWGWLLGGALIAYYRATRMGKSEKDLPGNTEKKRFAVNKKNTAKKSDSSYLLAAFAAGLVGLFLALPPFVSDSRWKSAMSEQSLPKIEESMQPSYFNPQNVNRYVMNVRLLEESQLPDLAYKYALEAVKWNPDSFESWRFLYFISKSTPEDKERAVAKMQELDPLNPDVTAP
jgi:MFS family permease